MDASAARGKPANRRLELLGRDLYISWLRPEWHHGHFTTTTQPVPRRASALGKVARSGNCDFGAGSPVLSLASVGIMQFDIVAKLSDLTLIHERQQELGTFGSVRVTQQITRRYPEPERQLPNVRKKSSTPRSRLLARVVHPRGVTPSTALSGSIAAHAPDRH
jgi:hypothetical protein